MPSGNVAVTRFHEEILGQGSQTYGSRFLAPHPFKPPSINRIGYTRKFFIYPTLMKSDSTRLNFTFP